MPEDGNIHIYSPENPKFPEDISNNFLPSIILSRSAVEYNSLNP
jgi:hypothetical protein